MQKPSNGSTPNPIGIYYFSGVGTSRDFLEPIREEMSRIIHAETGMESGGQLLFPYGDWSRRMIAQIREVWHDLRLPFHRWSRSIGGSYAAGDLHKCSPSGTLVLVGHSGGGVAALHTAYLLRNVDPTRNIIVFQIGSPACPVPEGLRDATAFCYSGWRNGTRKDPISRLGSWWAWPEREQDDEALSSLRQQSRRNRLPRLHPPGTMLPLTLKGQHPDYFRTHLMDGKGRTNLSITSTAMWEFIRTRLD